MTSKKFTIVVENTKAGLKTLLFAGIPEDDPTILDHNRRLEEYQRLRQYSVSEFTSQPFCNTPGCTIHHTPSCSPIKITQNTKSTATKRKENEDGYISPSNFLSVNVEGYDNKGVTQCYSCQKFNHTADNCRLTPRCLKCGENHQTRECGIQKVEQAFCINCQKFGHMANYAGCPLYPKPKKSTTTTNNNNYTAIVNSLVRPNISYAQATNNNSTNSNPQQQMAPPIKAAPVNKSQTQASRESTAPQIINSNQNTNAALITQTLQGIIQALTTLTAQISNMNFTNNTPQTNKPKKSKNLKKHELCALIEAIYDDDDE
ncbi:PRE_C2HC domain-containing protein [Trichonephila clavipes]|nr:PRE_C2HC domain-containing protein [Trichonephila clavipes]